MILTTATAFLYPLDGAADMNPTLGLYVGRMCQFLRLKSSKMRRNSVNHDARAPFFPVCGYTKQPTFAVTSGGSDVLHVCGLRNIAQIRNSVAPLTILVVVLDVLANYTELSFIFGWPREGEYTITRRIRRMHFDEVPARRKLAELVQVYLDAAEPDGKH